MPKSTATLVRKINLIPKVFLLIYKTDLESTFVPGQFYSFQIAEGVNRPYSACFVGSKSPNFYGLNLPELESGEYLSFMISTKPGGEASAYFENVEEDSNVTMIGPSGRFTLRENDKPKVFIATGTGLAPFVSMIHEILNRDDGQKLTLIFGAWKSSDIFSSNFFLDLDEEKKSRLRIVNVVEDLEGQTETENILGGRVTTTISQILPSIENHDFYLCGHPAMVSAMAEVLVALGAKEGEDLFLERFGVVKKDSN